MNKLQRLFLSFTLMSVLAASAFAGETPSTPCAPGETQTPPCSSQSVSDGSTVTGEVNSPPASDIDVIGIAEIALGSLLLF
jgi:hypothetical protein